MMFLQTTKPNTLDELIQTRFKTTDKGSNSHNYVEYYLRYFEQARKRKIKLLEIGVGGGDFLRACGEYFENVELFGIDNNPAYLPYEKEGIRMFIGSQADITFLRKTMAQIGKMDVIIDDGGHFMSLQKASLRALLPWVNRGGMYVIEDLFSSRDGRFTDEKPTTVDLLKEISSAVCEPGNESKDIFIKFCRQEIYTMQFYKNICFIFMKL